MSEALDQDLLAAEYVLGSLDPEQAQVAARMLAEDPIFERAVEVWQHRLTPLSVLAPSAEPPADLWQRIVQSTTPKAENVVPLRRMRLWQASTAGALAVAASLAAFVILRQAEPSAIAVLTPIVGEPSVLLATSEAGRKLRIRPNGPIAVPDGKDLELWALPSGQTRPRSLGVVPADGRQIVAHLEVDTQLMVSLEPRGGSPTGQPTGPVIYAGRLTRFN
jgi:anti-sigma-K factor RskA